MTLPERDDDDRAWAERLRALPRSIEPAGDLFPDVARRVAARDQKKRTFRLVRGGGFVLAAAAAVALAIGGARWLRGPASGVASHDTASYEEKAGGMSARPDPDGADGLLPEEAAYRAAITELRATLAAHAEQLPAEAADTVKDQLQTLDDAVATTRAALSEHPADPTLIEELRDEYQQEIDVLNDMIDLTTRT